MDIKKQITSKFDKSKFKLLNDGRDIHVDDEDWNGIDEYIRVK